MIALLEQLQFLRPEWFLAFIPLLLYIVFALRRKTTSASWLAVCDAKLLPHLLADVVHKRSRWPLFIIAFATSLCIIAMAGPVLHKLPQPVFRETSSLVIALDVSQSMDAADIKPSRLERAKLKLLDILDMRKGGQTALIVYAADAFTVTPLTDDTATIANLVPTLETSLMPAQGSRASKAIVKARALLEQSGVSHGDILLMTDGIRASDLDTIKPLPAQNIRLSMLGFGTPEGGPIPLETGFLQDRDGAIVIPKLEPELLQSAAKFGGGIYLNMQADDSDIKRLGKLFNTVRARQHSEATELTADSWREEGPWLLLLAIPLAALGARRGWLACVVLLFMTMQVPTPVYADDNVLDKLKLDPQYLWLTPDQKAARTLEQGDAASAADMFVQPQWKAAAQYRAGQYEQALKNMPEAHTSDQYYNRGNALAQLKRYEEALAAYDEALKLAPGLDDAIYNRELVEQELEKQQQQQQQQQNQNQDSDSDKDQQDQQQEQQEQQDQQSAEQNESTQDQDTQSKSQQQDQQRQEQSQEQAKQEEMPETEQEKDNLRAEQEEPEQDNTEQQEMQEQMQADYKDNADASEDEQASEQWLRRIPDDPGGLLRRKFIYQYGRMPNQVEDEQPW